MAGLRPQTPGARAPTHPRRLSRPPGPCWRVRAPAWLFVEKDFCLRSRGRPGSLAARASAARLLPSSGASAFEVGSYRPQAAGSDSPSPRDGLLIGVFRARGFRITAGNSGMDIFHGACVRVLRSSRKAAVFGLAQNTPRPAGDCLRKARGLLSSAAHPPATGAGVWTQVPRAQACDPSSVSGGKWEAHSFRNRVRGGNALLSLGSRGPEAVGVGGREPRGEGSAEAAW